MADKYIKHEDAKIILQRAWIEDPFRRQEAFDELNSIPSADVAEVRHGEWCEFMEDPINQRNYGGQTGYYECSNCKFVEDYRPNFCPNCGARMGGKDINVSTNEDCET